MNPHHVDPAHGGPAVDRVGTSVEFRADGTGARVVLTEHGMYLPGQEQPGWREQGTARQLDALAAEFATTAGRRD